MIPVEKPTDKVILNVLEGFLAGSYTRDDIENWYRLMNKEYATQYPGCISFHTETKTGHFIVYSLSFIKHQGISKYEDPNEYFLRDSDIKEYIADLNQVDGNESFGKIKRLRGHQIVPRKDTYPLICLDCEDDGFIQQCGVFFQRGIVDDLAEHTEFATINYDGSLFSILFSPISNFFRGR